MPAECTHVLPSEAKCAQFALRGKPFCREHVSLASRERSERSRYLVQNIPIMDIVSLSWLLLDTITDIRAKNLPPRHAEAIFAAAADRLTELEEALLTATESDGYKALPPMGLWNQTVAR